MSSSSNFNSRPCERGDGISAKRIAKELISIHAPARGATQQLRLAAVAPLFQFTPLREGRPPNALIVRVCMQFQFTPLREGRHLPAFSSLDFLISIHAPARGATAKSNKICSVFSAIIEKNSQLLDNTSFLKHPVF